MISLKNTPLIIFVLFLAFYTFQKYTAVPQNGFNSGYAISVAIIVALTALMPYIITRIKMRFTSGALRVVTVLIAPVVVSAIGFALYFYGYIAPNFPGVSIAAVLPRSIFPGVVISGILLLSLAINRAKA